MNVLRALTAPYRWLDMTANRGLRAFATIAVVAACFGASLYLFVTFFTLPVGRGSGFSPLKERFEVPGIILSVTLAAFAVSLLAWGSLRIGWFVAAAFGVRAKVPRYVVAAILGAVFFVAMYAALMRAAHVSPLV